MSVCAKCLRPTELVYGGNAVMACACNNIDTRASVVRYLRAMAVHLRTKALARGLVSQLDAQYLAQQAEGYECAALDLEQKLDLDPERLRELGIEP